mmetsp:Transcript_30623/g.66833  ORF Transcript_30623/g.66833 Transcript_30623/m.66833 type:complete len:263 (+) Transcript_30623:4678-5466(+)
MGLVQDGDCPREDGLRQARLGGRPVDDQSRLSLPDVHMRRLRRRWAHRGACEVEDQTTAYLVGVQHHARHGVSCLVAILAAHLPLVEYPSTVCAQQLIALLHTEVQAAADLLPRVPAIQGRPLNGSAQQARTALLVGRLRPAEAPRTSRTGSQEHHAPDAHEVGHLARLRTITGVFQPRQSGWWLLPRKPWERTRSGYHRLLREGHGGHGTAQSPEQSVLWPWSSNERGQLRLRSVHHGGRAISIHNLPAQRGRHATGRDAH